MENFKLRNKLETGEMRAPSFGNISLDIDKQTLSSTESEITEHLSKSQYQVLWLLVRAAGKPVSSEEFNSFLYEDQPENKDLPLYSPLNVFITHLRKKLNKVSNGTMSIENYIGEGWYLTSQ